MPLIRKERAGNDSFGNTWSGDGAVIEVDAEQAAALLAIDDGGFSEVTPDSDNQPEPEELSEVDPDAPDGEPEAKPAAKKTAARKTATRKPVEE